MALEVNQVAEILKSPRAKSEIAEAVNHELRLSFHTDPVLDIAGCKATADIFLKFVETLLPADKFETFKHLLRFPLFTTGVVGKVYNNLEKVYNAGDSAIEYDFVDSESRDDWEAYRSDILKASSVWEEKGWQMFKSAINSVLIVDLPVEQEGDKPSPYFYWLNIADVRDYELKDGVIQWIIFNQLGSKIAVFDDMSYRVFQLNDKGEIEGAALVESSHLLGYCPATFFWNTSISQSKPWLKKSPLTKELTQLDWLLFFSTAKKQLDISGAYPIYSAYREDCYYQDAEGNACENGYITISKSDDTTTTIKCPKCSIVKQIGPGTLWSVPMPKERDDPDLRNPISMLSVDVNSLEYNRDEVVRMSEDVFSSIVSGGSSESTKQAMNADQVASNFASKTTVLKSIATNFARAQTFVDDTICLLRYGRDKYLGSSINWGSKFYLYSTEELYSKYEQAKKNGSNDSELDAISLQIVETEHKNNPTQLQRALILRELEPFRHKTLTEVLTLNEKGLIDDDMVRIKVNFSSLIDRFERESINVIEFGTNLSMDLKIKTITNKLLEYVKGNRNNRESTSNGENSNTSKGENSNTSKGENSNSSKGEAGSDS